MAQDGVITDRDTMLQNPPDILLTNYKMLDYLLVRPKDTQLWKNNSPETLKYIAVDELHTFDGAQGTDLVCLLRRLKNRLGIQNGHLCCVGTSATMGSKESAGNILKYASEIFGEPFDEETAIVTEDRLSYSEFLENAETSEYNIPARGEISELKTAIEEDDADSYIKKAVKAWFPEFSDDCTTDSGKISLSKILPKHIFFQSLIASVNSSFCQTEYVIEELKSGFTELNEITSDEANVLVESMVALISWARTGSEGNLSPFLNVHVQLWIKEQRRLLGKVSNDKVNAWAYEIYCDFCKTNGGIPSEPEQVAEIAVRLGKKMSAGKILMPEKPVQVYVNSKMAGFQKRLEKELAK